MNNRHLLGWIALAAAGFALVAWIYPRVLPLAPATWRVTEQEAVAVALERFRDLGEPVADPYVISRVSTDPLLERRLQLETAAVGEASVASGELARRIVYWQIYVYPPGAQPGHWTYRARVTLDGELISLRRRLGDEEEAGLADPGEARAAADAFLREQGFDLGRYAEPSLRSQQIRERTDLSFRYTRRQLELGADFPYGVEVGFAGDQLTGFHYWFDDPEESALSSSLQPFQFLIFGRNLTVLFLLPLVAVPFIRRYHAGEVGVKRGLQVGGVVFASALVLMAFTAGHFSEGNSAGVLSRVQMTYTTAAWMTGFLFLPIALMAFLAWSVGESLLRERGGSKLAAFDAVCQGDLANATVARSSLRGVASGALLAAAVLAVGFALKLSGRPPLASFEFESWWLSSHWAGAVILVFYLAFVPYSELFGRLFLVPWTTQRFGAALGCVVSALVAGVLCWGPTMWVFSIFWVLAIGVLAVAALIFLFLRYDLLTSLTAAFFTNITLGAWPLVVADDPWLQFQGLLPLVAAGVPLLLSLKSVASEREFVYRYDDVPPHVRRIAERERQRVELETARRIQSSILPELPPQLNGVQIAHSYLPATEVGGDFYDVMALEDGRLAVAVGDVAGHGVSSGLVMSMAKSALAVQVTFNPDVEAVFTTLNRMVYQSARRRLLTTLCYVLVDPRERELFYASAGHLFPYRITGEGKVLALESVSYPLGVRDSLEVTVRADKLAAGDQLVLFSDGVVEARREGSDELFGFERLERSLRRHAPAGVTGLRDGVLDDLKLFTGSGPQEDDLTLLVLQLP